MSTFRAVQRFHQLPLVGLVVFLAASTWVMAVDRMAFGHAHGIDPAPTWLVIAAWVVFGLGLPLFLSKGAALITMVGERGIRVRIAPLAGLDIPFSSIAGCRVIRVPPPAGLGHWRIRTEVGSAQAFVLQGGLGVAIDRHAGGPVVIGSRRAYELADAVDAGIGSCTGSSR